MSLARSGICAVVFTLLFSPIAMRSQTVISQPESSQTQRRIHLILKDGSYQVVTSYSVVGNVVKYVSAERAGEHEEIPVELVDLDATRRWEKAHTPVAEGGDKGRAPVLDPELMKEEQERQSLTPMIEPDLRLPEEDSVLALDEFQGKPELVPLTQSEGDLNHTTAHSVLKKALNPKAAAHQVLTLKGEKSFVQLHVDTPAIYLRIGEATAPSTGGAPLTVDTHGASSAKSDSDVRPDNSQYVIVRTDVRVDARLVASFSLEALDSGKHIDDVIEMNQETLAGGHWMKLSPKRPLEFGEYVLLEVISEKEINLGVWDFGIHPQAPENRDVLKPEPKRRIDLERRRAHTDPE
jgi:hypothetical protein